MRSTNWNARTAPTCSFNFLSLFVVKYGAFTGSVGAHSFDLGIPSANAIFFPPASVLRSNNALKQCSHQSCLPAPSRIVGNAVHPLA
jgi:hypothetical protein